MQSVPLIHSGSIHPGAPVSAGAYGLLPRGLLDADVDDILARSTVVGAAGGVIGTLAEIYLDNQSGIAHRGAVETGGHRCPAPQGKAWVDGNAVWVPITGEQVTLASHQDPATALTVDDEHDLDRHRAIALPARPFHGARRASSVQPRAGGDHR